jgi:hypothetical protein
MMHMNQYDAGPDGGPVVVNVTAYFNSTRALRGINVCQLRGEETEQGLGIFVSVVLLPDKHNHLLTVSQSPEHDSYQPPDIWFWVDVYLPMHNNTGRDDHSHLHSRRVVHSVMSDMPGYMHWLARLDQYFIFGALYLSSGSKLLHVQVRIGVYTLISTAKFTFQGVQANDAVMQTTSGPFRGTISSLKSVVLKTDTGIIDANVSMTNRNLESPSFVGLFSRTGHIRSNVEMWSSMRRPSAVKVLANTTTQPIFLNVTQHDSNVTALVQAHTSDAEVKLLTNEFFEGAYYARSTGVKPHILKSKRTNKDPTGQGRKRVLEENERSWGDVRFTRGSIMWGDETDPDSKGIANVTTTNADAIIYFQT